MKKCLFILLLLASSAYAGKRVVNVYAWGGEIPKVLIHQFEQETGIHVNFSTYDNNETLYTKVHASRPPVYDVILPSAHFVERLRKQGYLVRLDKTALPNAKNLNPTFSGHEYDPGNLYSVPLIWGATGIFYNEKWVTSPPQSWSDLWRSEWHRQLLLLDDPREVFGIALLSLGMNLNDDNPVHIQAAYEQLKKLTPNIKLFASESIQALLIDEDVHVGAVWNGDAFKASQENKSIQFVYPKEGFGIWIDCLAILKNAPHMKEAYEFINFMLKAESAKTIALSEGHAVANQAGYELLPKAIRDDRMVYPSPETLRRGTVQRDVPNESLWLYNYYWQKLKFSL